MKLKLCLPEREPGLGIPLSGHCEVSSVSPHVLCLMPCAVAPAFSCSLFAWHVSLLLLAYLNLITFKKHLLQTCLLIGAPSLFALM